MGIEFVLLGIYFIWQMFYSKKDRSNLLIIFAVFSLLLGYFIGNIIIGNIMINVCNVLGLVLLILFAAVKSCDMKNAIISGIMIGCIYGLINYIDIDYNLFFNEVTTIIVILVVNFLNKLSVEDSVLSVVIGIVLIEIFNIFLLLKKLEFVALFGESVVLCIVVCIGCKILADYVVKMIKGVRCEKIN